MTNGWRIRFAAKQARRASAEAKSADRNSLKPSQLQGIAIGMKSRSFDCRRLGG